MFQQQPDYIIEHSDTRVADRITMPLYPENKLRENILVIHTLTGNDFLIV
jgi:hypothetical protein